MTGQQQPRIPTSTYRLQFNRQFTFTHAREIVPYLDALGISDCYASPYFQARAESLHGYDITDHNKLNAAIGSRADYDAWIADLPEPKPSRPEAIRRILADALGADAGSIPVEELNASNDE